MRLLLIVLFFFMATGTASAISSYHGYSKLPEPPATSKGESVYKESDCALCHGELGDGEGFLAEGLDPRPRDFTNFSQMMNLPDLQMANAIREGIKGTGMPAHPDFNDEQIEELILYLRSLLAETYLTLNLCLNASHVVDVGREGLDLDEFRIIVDNPDLVTVKQEGPLIHISPSSNWSTLKALFSKKKVTRTHVKLIEKNNTLSLIAVRLHRCLS